MKFLANENFPYASVLKLREAGYDIISIGEDNPGISDEEIIQLAINQNKIILTFDRDYGTLIFKHGYRPIAGVLYLRIHNFIPEFPAHLLISLFEKKIIFENFFTVIDELSIRQRRIK